MIKEIPRYECLLECAENFPGMDPSAMELFLHVLRAGDVCGRFGDQSLEKHGLSRARFLVLILLLDKSKNLAVHRSPAELADEAMVTRATMTGLLDNLAKDGLIEIEPSSTDRRQKMVTLSAKGFELLQSVLPPHFEEIGRALKGIELRDRKRLVKGLGGVIKHVEEFQTRRGVGFAG
ncbi:MAG: MarR family winged helix-turn-helix transcriptional regulator [Puniceicoccaceae bacterium]